MGGSATHFADQFKQQSGEDLHSPPRHRACLRARPAHDPRPGETAQSVLRPLNAPSGIHSGSLLCQLKPNRQKKTTMRIHRICRRRSDGRQHGAPSERLRLLRHRRVSMSHGPTAASARPGNWRPSRRPRSPTSRLRLKSSSPWSLTMRPSSACSVRAAIPSCMGAKRAKSSSIAQRFRRERMWKIEKRARSAGAVTLEGCMASSIPQARNGTLYLMCGGDRANLRPGEAYSRKAQCCPSLHRFNRTGGAGKGARQHGHEHQHRRPWPKASASARRSVSISRCCARCFLQTGANSQVLKTDGEDMQNRDHDCFFSASHAAKDSTIAWILGAEQGLPLPLAGATKQQFDRMVALGLGGLDKSGVAELTFKGRHALSCRRRSRFPRERTSLQPLSSCPVCIGRIRGIFTGLRANATGRSCDLLRRARLPR
jgi:hypothetical protein